MKHLAERSPGLDIFTEGYVRRDAAGWLLTAIGRDFLKVTEATKTEPRRVERLLEASTDSKVFDLQERRQVRLKLPNRLAARVDLWTDVRRAAAL